MSNLKKALDVQQRINEAAQKIMHYFDEDTTYEEHLESMLNAQTQIVGLMELSKTQVMRDRNSEFLVKTDELTYFLHDVHTYLTMLKPFIELMEEQKGKREA